jgi:hypothetical protein
VAALYHAPHRGASRGKGHPWAMGRAKSRRKNTGI